MDQRPHTRHTRIGGQGWAQDAEQLSDAELKRELARMRSVCCLYWQLHRLRQQSPVIRGRSPGSTTGLEREE